MPNIIITTFGGTWAILPEILSFCNYPKIQVFKNNQYIKNFYDKLKYINATNIDELWVICTNSDETLSALDKFMKWCSFFDNNLIPEIRYIGLKNIYDLTTEIECYQMTDLIYRSVLKASEYKKNGKLLLSLAGGRKTMSSDMQRAADLFGCDLLFHIADKTLLNRNIRFNNPEDLAGVLDKVKANIIFPVEIRTNLSRNIIIDIPEKIYSKDFDVEFSLNNEPSLKLLNEVNYRLANAEANHFNLYRNRTQKTKHSIFYGLLQINPTILNLMEKEFPDYIWLKTLPKIDLHCHLGGILDINGLIKVALANNFKIQKYLNESEEFRNWYYNEIKQAVVNKNNEVLKNYLKNKEKLRNLLNGKIEKPIAVAAFISCFEYYSDYLEKLIYDVYLNDNNFKNIGFDEYEKLGDLQGSGLLQSKESLEKTCEILLEYCYHHNVKYLELRCSPCNYTLGELDEMDVIKILYNKLFNDPNIKIRLIIIGSRHGREDLLERHINLVLECKNINKYKDFIVGFDIAGNEAHKSPAELRKKLLPLMKECIKFTIHAGENQPVENIWEAVYELNADRIGHGLTLIDKPELMKRFKDRNIFIELCPSSNHQICNFDIKNGGKNYPLRYYFDFGLKVTINTDNPGISRTDITNEYLFASKVAGLSKYEILNILRNSVQAVFISKDEKKQLMIDIENELYNLLK